MHSHESHNRGPHDEVIGVGAGALAGAVVAGPVGAVVGGVAGLVYWFAAGRFAGRGPATMWAAPRR